MMQMLIKKILYIVCFTLITTSAQAATYNWYFSNIGDDANYSGGDLAGSCEIGDPCETLSTADTAINAASVGDIVNIYFARGSTWEYDTAQVTTTNYYGIEVSATDPTVRVDEYGSGDLPVFDGLVGEAGYEDWDAVPNHHATNGPARWYSWFLFKKAGCSVNEIEVTRTYGNGIRATYAGATDLTVTNCVFHDIGNSAVNSDGGDSSNLSSGNTLTGNIVYSGSLLHKEPGYETACGTGASSWCHSGALTINNNVAEDADHYIAYNVVYDFYGEGINIMNGTAEYNIVGDTLSVGIDPAAHWDDYGTTNVRYNYIMCSSSTDYCVGADAVGIRMYDDRTDTGDGDNTSGVINIYGNIIINRSYGLRIFMTGAEEPNSEFLVGRFYNNLIIDSKTANISMDTSDAEDFWTNGYIYNNASILYDRTSSTHASDGSTSVPVNWDIDYNAYWTTGGSPSVDADWDDNYVTGDPKLLGEALSVDWDGQSGAMYYTDISFNLHLYLASDSALIDSGKVLTTGYVQSLLGYGTVFEEPLDSGSYTMVDNSTKGVGPEIGAVVYGSSDGRVFIIVN